MLKEIKTDAEERMKKTIEALGAALMRIRTGRAHPDLLDPVMVKYYGNDTPLKQVASVTIEDNRTLLVTPWERGLLPEIEKAILKSDLGVTPSNSGNSIRLPMPPLTEQTRRDLTRVARGEAEQARVAIRNVRRDAIADVRELLKEKEISEDDDRRTQEEIQKLTDRYVARVEEILQRKETDLMAV
jgi:ribosome recycling factor